VRSLFTPPPPPFTPLSFLAATTFAGNATGSPPPSTSGMPPAPSLSFLPREAGSTPHALSVGYSYADLTQLLVPVLHPWIKPAGFDLFRQNYTGSAPSGWLPVYRTIRSPPFHWIMIHEYPILQADLIPSDRWNCGRGVISSIIQAESCSVGCKRSDLLPLIRSLDQTEFCASLPGTKMQSPGETRPVHSSVDTVNAAAVAIATAESRTQDPAEPVRASTTPYYRVISFFSLS
jgi:hypothetical protein